LRYPAVNSTPKYLLFYLDFEKKESKKFVEVKIILGPLPTQLYAEVGVS